MMTGINIVGIAAISEQRRMSRQNARTILVSDSHGGLPSLSRAVVSTRRKHREVHIATGENQGDTFAPHAIALLEQRCQSCGAGPLRHVVSVREQMAHRRLDLIL